MTNTMHPHASMKITCNFFEKTCEIEYIENSIHLRQGLYTFRCSMASFLCKKSIINNIRLYIILNEEYIRNIPWIFSLNIKYNFISNALCRHDAHIPILKV